MIRIRFHGRGGHGVKTASRIVGTAAFLAGFQAQDSPVYGAERRGAPVVAFARIDEQPILERGVIEWPDLIVVADETLFEDPTARVLAGQDSASAVVANANCADRLSEQFELKPRVIAVDMTGRTVDVLGKPSALSAALGAAAVKATGCVSEAYLVNAVRDELEHLQVGEETIEQNLTVALGVFAEVPSVAFERAEANAGTGVYHVPYDDPIRATPSVLTTGNSSLRQTGGWRVERPEIDYDACTRCGLCFVRCPDGAIALDDNGYPVIDYDHCKGCMICRQICPISGIAVTKETQAW